MKAVASYARLRAGFQLIPISRLTLPTVEVGAPI